MRKAGWIAGVVVGTALVGCQPNVQPSSRGDDDLSALLGRDSNRPSKGSGKGLGKCMDETIAPYDVELSTLGAFSKNSLSAHTRSSEDRDFGNGVEGRLSLLVLTSMKPGRYDISQIAVSANLHVNLKGESERGFYAGHEGTLVIESFDEANQKIVGYVEDAVFLEEDETYDPIPGGCVGRAKRIGFTVEGDSE